MLSANDKDKSLLARDLTSDTESGDEELNIQALPVIGDPLPFKPGEIADNANDYLRQVRWEAGRIKDVIVSDKPVEEDQKILNKDYASIFDLANERFNRHDLILKRLPELWRKHIVDDFRDMRECIEKLRKLSEDNKKSFMDSLYDVQMNVLDPETFFANKDIFLKNFEETDPNHQIAPSLSILVNCNFVNCCKLIELIMEAVDQIIEEQTYVITYHKSLWIYSLLAVLDMPLPLDLCGVLNQLKKSIIVSYENYNQDYADYEQYRAMMATLLVVIADYFRP